MKVNIHTVAPLPFQGQKRRFVNHYRKLLTARQPAAVIDLFGGSGLLSHIAARTLPQSKVIYNDYDNYQRRLQYINNTNSLLSDIRNILKNIKKDSKIIGRERELIIERIKQEKDFTDWITLSSSLLFSAKYALDFKTFAAQTFYNKVKQVNYSCDGYLDGLTVVQSDYYNVYLEYKNAPNALFVFDPPYLATDSSTYSSDNYWKLKDYLNVLRTLDGVEYVYFTSEKSSIIELLTWIEKTYNITSPFSGAKKIEIGTQMNHVSRYVDIMLYKISA